MLLAMLLSSLGLIGCKQRLFLTEDDYSHYQSLMPSYVETTAASLIQPEPLDTPAPPTVLDPERPARYMSLAECIALALEQGRTGGGGSFLFGGELPAIDVPTQAGQLTSDAIRVLALNPAIAHTDIESALSRFDARWTTAVSWQHTDRPVGTALDNFQAGAQTSSIQLRNATASTSLVKPLPTGGVAGITFRTDYELSNLQQRVNPAYRPVLTFGFEQPLFQGFGTEINQLRAAHPGSQLFQANIASRAAGILLTRLSFDQSRVDFEFAVSAMCLRVESSYWNLYGAYWALYAREQALRQSYTAWRLTKSRYEAGSANIIELAQTRGQYELFRGRRLEAMGLVLENERVLRGVLGMEPQDGTRIVPIDAPTVAPYTPDCQACLNETMAQFPSLILARQFVKANQLSLINQKNLLLPDVRFTSTYELNDIGNRLDTETAANAFRNLRQAEFANWSLGLRAEIPLGYRDAHAAVRQARLRLAQSFIQLRDQEQRARSFMTRVYRNIFEFHELIKTSRAEREAFAEQLDARFKQFAAGRVTLEFLLESQRNWADALEREYQAIVNYNQALAGLEFAKGGLLQYNNVVISEGALPAAAQVRAVEHLKERSKALVLIEHANPVPTQDTAINGAASGLPILPQETAPALPALLKNTTPVPEIKEPMPREAEQYLHRASHRAPAGLGKPATARPLPTGPSEFPAEPASQAEPLGSEGGNP